MSYSMSWAVEKIEGPIAEIVVSRKLTDTEAAGLEGDFAQVAASVSTKSTFYRVDLPWRATGCGDTYS